ncbi:MAG TPA: class I SAM-dependent methyltransferase [Anaerolineales bacterium]
MNLELLESVKWKDYELLDSGDGLKLERFGPYRFVRPEAQAIWKRALPQTAWEDIHAVFQPTSEESGGHWQLKKRVDEKWAMTYGGIKFWAMTTPGRHLGVFPEVAVHWDWYSTLIEKAARPVKVLNLFGYTGLASLMVARAGAQVTHLDASKKSVTWARENQVLSGLEQKPIRWIVDDALRFVEREGRRGAKYDGIILDPPKFGRGPKGEIWEVYESLPALLAACGQVLNPSPLFIALTVYAVRASGVHLFQSISELMAKYKGKTDAGELVTREKSAGRLLSHAVYARWQAE